MIPNFPDLDALSHCLTCGQWITEPCFWAGCEFAHDAGCDGTERHRFTLVPDLHGPLDSAGRR